MKKNILCALLGFAMVAGVGLDALGAVAFGPGKVSKFTVSGVGSGVLVGASGVTWSSFSDTDYYGTKVFVNKSIVDAEKTAAKDADDLWCYHISDMDALFLTGWAKKTSFSNVDAMKNHFTGDTIRKVSGGTTVEGTYGFVRDGMWGDLFYWYKNASGVDLAARGALTEGKIDSSFASTLKSLMDDGGHVVRVNVFFANVSTNPRWKGAPSVHGVLCVGYVANGNTLKALFLVDPDNDQFTGSGGTSAPNSVMYCPVSWNSSSKQYTITGVWGQNGILNHSQASPNYRALAVLKESTPSSGTYTVHFSACGGTGTMANQKLTVNASATLRKNAFTRSGHVFLGWAKSKSGKVAYKNEATVKNLASKGKTVTLYAKWAKKNYKIKFYANGGKGTMAVQKFTYGKAKTLSKNKFTRKGYVFKGWATTMDNAKAGKVKYKNGKSVKNLVTDGKTVKLYAVWKKNGNTDATTLDAAIQPSGGKLKFTTGGDVKWKVSDSVSHDGNKSARSGKVAQDGVTWLRTTVSGPGTISFWWKGKIDFDIDPEDYFSDGCCFYVGAQTRYKACCNGKNRSEFQNNGWKLSTPDSKGWHQITVPVSGSGKHELEWWYKWWDGGRDAFWLDDIRWTPSN